MLVVYALVELVARDPCASSLSSVPTTCCRLAVEVCRVTRVSKVCACAYAPRGGRASSVRLLHVVSLNIPAAVVPVEAEVYRVACMPQIVILARPSCTRCHLHG